MVWVAAYAMPAHESARPAISRPRTGLLIPLPSLVRSRCLTGFPQYVYWKQQINPGRARGLAPGCRLAGEGAAALLGLLLGPLLLQRLLRNLLAELLGLLLSLHATTLCHRCDGKQKGGPSAALYLRFPSVSAAQASGQAQTHR